MACQIKGHTTPIGPNRKKTPHRTDQKPDLAGTSQIPASRQPLLILKNPKELEEHIRIFIHFGVGLGHRSTPKPPRRTLLA